MAVSYHGCHCHIRSTVAGRYQSLGCCTGDGGDSKGESDGDNKYYTDLSYLLPLDHYQILENCKGEMQRTPLKTDSTESQYYKKSNYDSVESYVEHHHHLNSRCHVTGGGGGVGRYQQRHPQTVSQSSSSRCCGSIGEIAASTADCSHRQHDNGESTTTCNADSSSDSCNGNENINNSSQTQLQAWYFHAVASFILVVHGLTFLVPHDLSLMMGMKASPESAALDTDMLRTIAKWLGYDISWIKPITPYAQGFACVLNISLGIVSWWTCKELYPDRYNRLVQLRVFAFCLNILHAYITGPIIYQNEDVPLMATGRIIGLFRLSYLTPGLMAAGVTDVFVSSDKNQSKNSLEGSSDVVSNNNSGNTNNQTPVTTSSASKHNSKAMCNNNSKNNKLKKF